MLFEIGLEQFKLEADAAGLTPQHELRVGKCEPVGVGLQRLAGCCMGLQVGPRIGNAAVIQGGERRFHRGIVRQCRRKRARASVKALQPLQQACACVGQALVVQHVVAH